MVPNLTYELQSAETYQYTFSVLCESFSCSCFVPLHILTPKQMVRAHCIFTSVLEKLKGQVS